MAEVNEAAPTEPMVAVYAVALSRRVTDRNRGLVATSLRASGENTALSWAARVIEQAGQEPPPGFVRRGEALTLDQPELLPAPIPRMDGTQLTVGAAHIRIYRVASGVNVVTAWFVLGGAAREALDVTNPRISQGAGNAVEAFGRACLAWFTQHFPSETHAGNGTGSADASLIVCGVPEEIGLSELVRKRSWGTATNTLGVDSPGDLWRMGVPTQDRFRPMDMLLAASSSKPGERMLLVGEEPMQKHLGIDLCELSHAGTAGKLMYERLGAVDRVLALRTYAAHVAACDAELSRVSAGVAALGANWENAPSEQILPLLADYFRIAGEIDQAMLIPGELPSESREGSVRWSLRGAPADSEHQWSSGYDLDKHTREQVARLIARVQQRHPQVSENVIALTSTLSARDGLKIARESLAVSNDAYRVAQESHATSEGSLRTSNESLDISRSSKAIALWAIGLGILVPIVTMALEPLRDSLFRPAQGTSHQNPTTDPPKTIVNPAPLNVSPPPDSGVGRATHTTGSAGSSATPLPSPPSTPSPEVAPARQNTSPGKAGPEPETRRQSDSKADSNPAPPKSKGG
jgi:hypothetical protein